MEIFKVSNEINHDDTTKFLAMNIFVYSKITSKQSEFPIILWEQLYYKESYLKTFPVPLYMMTVFQSHRVCLTYPFSKVVSDCCKVVLPIFIITPDHANIFTGLQRATTFSLNITCTVSVSLGGRQELNCPSVSTRTPFSTFTLLTSSPLEFQAVYSCISSQSKEYKSGKKKRKQICQVLAGRTSGQIQDLKSEQSYKRPCKTIFLGKLKYDPVFKSSAIFSAQ